MAGIYIHVPFCKTRCIYCDFYSTTLGGSRSKLFVSRVLEEARSRKGFLAGEPVKTVYIGGGTPSQLDVEQLCRLVNGLSTLFDLSQVEEFTLEANPEDITQDYVASLPSCINRVSMGVQSFIDEELEMLHRRHNAEKARHAVSLLKQHGIGNISIDLMYGLPLQTLDSFAYSIQEAVACGTQHISAYNLQVEEGTQLHQLVSDRRLAVADDDTCIAMNEMLRSRLAAAGFEQYEISNYALPGRHSRHNSSYWTGAPYLGLGPGAHSYDGQRTRCFNEPDLLSYLDGQRHEETELLSDDDIFNERIMLGLRTSTGVQLDETRQMLAHFAQKGDHTHKETEEWQRHFQRYIDMGWICLTPTHHFRLTAAGLAKADEVMRELFL